MSSSLIVPSVYKDGEGTTCHRWAPQMSPWHLARPCPWIGHAMLGPCLCTCSGIAQAILGDNSVGNQKLLWLRIDVVYVWWPLHMTCWALYASQNHAEPNHTTIFTTLSWSAYNTYHTLVMTNPDLRSCQNAYSTYTLTTGQPKTLNTHTDVLISTGHGSM
jgi:hypothetical protein